jgi:preprotein translocase subunit YajC
MGDRIFFIFFFIFYYLKMRPKNQNMKPQKRYLEVSRSIGEEVRAFFRFTAKRKN